MSSRSSCFNNEYCIHGKRCKDFTIEEVDEAVEPTEFVLSDIISGNCVNSSREVCLRHIIKTNGIKKNYVIFGEQDDVFIDFKYKFFQTKDTNLKTNVEEYIKTVQHSNVLIDIRLSLTISYLSFLFDDILIYNSGTNTVLTFNSYAVKTLFAGYNKIFDQYEIKTVLFIYNFVYQFFSKQTPFMWNSDMAIKAVHNKPCLKNAVNVEAIIDYLNNIKFDLSVKSNIPPIDIKKHLHLNDDMKCFESCQGNIFKELLDLKNTCKFIMLL